jgi:translocation and assembly module TamB
VSRRRIAWRILAAMAALALLAVVAGVLVVRSGWFHDQVRRRIVRTVEDSTGGRVEIGAFQFDWRRMRAEVRGVVIHGLEPADKPPLFRADSAAVGLKIVSLLRRDVDIQYLGVNAPHVYLIVAEDGRTNIPQPKVQRTGGPGPMETILQLAIGRFNLSHGEVEVENRGKTPFEVHGKQLAAKLVYDATGPRYRGEVSVQPLDLLWNKGERIPFDIHASLTFEKNRIGVEGFRLTTGKSTVTLAGAVDDLAAPHAAFRYDARMDVADGARFLGIRGLSGQALVRGAAQWTGKNGFSLAGDLHASGLEFRTVSVRLQSFRADGKLTADSSAVRLRAVHIAGDVNQLFPHSLALDGSIGEAALLGNDLELHAMALGILGGTFRGEARLYDFERFRVKGGFDGVAARRVVALENSTTVTLPWDALASGEIEGEGSLTRQGGLRASGDLEIAPAPGSAPVQGHIAATYDSQTGIVDLGQSALRLPSSRATVSGAIGRQLQVHLETRDFNDILPALGTGATSFPVKLENGSAVFDGTVTGPPDDLHIQGHATATRVSYEGKLADGFQCDVTAGAQNVKVQNAVLTHGAMRVQGQMAVALREWKTGPASFIFGSLTVTGAGLAEVASLAGRADVPVSGTLDSTAAISGTVANPLVDADIAVRNAVFRREPVDRLTAHIRYAGNRVEVASGQVTAGAKQVSVAGSFDHPADRWDAGRLTFRVSSNAMPLDQIHTLEVLRPGIKGTVAITATGTLDLAAAKAGERGWGLRDLHVDVAGHGLQLTGQPIGDVHLTADSQAQALRAHFESAFAGSTIRGDGQWRLEGEYPGSATIAFTKLNFVNLRNWVLPSSAGAASDVQGSAEGQLRIDGPLLAPPALKFELRIPQLEVFPSQAAAGGAATAADALTLRNSGPIVATATNSVLTVESARLVGRATDLSVTGKAQFQQKNGLDLRVKGRVDLAIVHQINPDFEASGAVSADAAVRGSLDSPQIAGRTEFQNAAFSIVDIPNGISNANGVLQFAGNVATIQSFTGETGGGKVELSGFASYSGGQAIFRLAARARQVRIRYPEGLSTVADANLSLTGTSERSMLSGAVTIRRTGFNPQSDFSSLIVQSSEPVETPSARTGLLGGLHFDVQVNTAADLQLQSTLAQDLQAEANLQLRGTFANPAVLGRINVTRGQIVFFGTKYTINQGSVTFFNPLRIDPVIDVALETKARGVDVTLTISGPLHHLNLTPSSDPPLAFNEIVALLATGRAPTGDPALLAQQNSTPQSWQQTGASTLLGQAIASPVAGRLERFFGVSNLRIDPTISGGVENNPQARLTLEQQVTRDITFTYITNVTTSNPQVVRVEWSFSQNWSAVALREENGMFGLDFYFKKRFK